MLKVYGILYMIATVIVSVSYIVDDQVWIGLFYLINIFTGFAFVIIQNNNDEISKLKETVAKLQEENKKTNREVEHQFYKVDLQLKEKLKQEKD